ncbi:MAG: hypothetical protein U0359_13165 [Byssovorax sp.]
MSAVGCGSVAAGWHFAGGIVYWTFGTSCGIPSIQTPENFGSEFARWDFSIKKSGTYQIAVKIPPSAAACGLTVDKYTTGAKYYLINGANKQSTILNQKASIGQEVVLFANSHLDPGTMNIYLYDSVTDLNNCCASCNQSIRVFLDYAKVTWVGP